MSAEHAPAFDDERQPREALRESEERFRMLADNMSQLAWTCYLLGNVTWYNKRWLDDTGLTFEDMKGWGWKMVQHPDHVDRDVTEQKLAEEQMARQAEALGALNERLQELARLKNRTPLTLMLGPLEDALADTRDVPPVAVAPNDYFGGFTKLGL